MSGAAVHDAGLSPASATIVRKIERLTKDRAKELVAAGIQRNSTGGALDQLALAGGCSKRCLEKAMAHETLPSLDVLLNALDFAPTLLDEVLKARGFRLAARLAARVGLTEASISRIRRGEQNIRRSVMRDIIAASGGVVTADGLVLDHGDEDASDEGVTSSGNGDEVSASATVSA